MKTETYTFTTYRELDKLIEEHLGVRLKVWDHDIHEFVGDWDGIPADMELGNDTYFIFDPEHAGRYLEEPEDWHGKTCHYLSQLTEKGLLPKEHKILVEVSW